MKILIDCDYIVYKCCAAAETEMDFGDDVIVVTSNFSDAMKCVQRDLDRIQSDLGSFDDELVLFFTSPNNFRKKILPEYKGHRQRKNPLETMSSQKKPHRFQRESRKKPPVHEKTPFSFWDEIPP